MQIYGPGRPIDGGVIADLRAGAGGAGDGGAHIEECFVNLTSQLSRNETDVRPTFGGFLLDLLPVDVRPGGRAVE